MSYYDTHQKDCRHVWSDDCEPACTLCGLVGDVVNVDAFQKDKLMRRHDRHCPKEYQGIKLGKLGGITQGYIEWMEPTLVKAGLLACVTWADVYKFLNQQGAGQEWLSVPHYLKWSVDFHSLSKLAMHLVYARDYNLGLMYVMRKLADIHDYTHADQIPVKMSASTLAKSEGIWLQLCMREGLPYRELALESLVVPWVKDPSLLDCLT